MKFWSWEWCRRRWSKLGQWGRLFATQLLCRAEPALESRVCIVLGKVHSAVFFCPVLSILQLRMQQHMTDLQLQPLTVLLRRTLDQLQQKDPVNIFADPVSVDDVSLFFKLRTCLLQITFAMGYIFYSLSFPAVLYMFCFVCVYMQ